jgi:Fe2+ transport system protein B
LPKKPTIVALTKLDIADASLRREIKKLKFRKGISIHYISAITGEGLGDLVGAMWKVLEKK